ncbi:hypothetical protein GCM10011399_13600 [Subtercola lobariae]|uniref:Transmembrane protein n=1 Tax=Subtercola lobariae TaxID=1588641 RepID=A0A917EXK5_9MICO|nr:hypothetical protein GCM10011399_13600 [Subtercola lobariae]
MLVQLIVSGVLVKAGTAGAPVEQVTEVGVTEYEVMTGLVTVVVGWVVGCAGCDVGLAVVVGLAVAVGVAVGVGVALVGVTVALAVEFFEFD